MLCMTILKSIVNQKAAFELYSFFNGRLVQMFLDLDFWVLENGSELKYYLST